MSVKYAPVLWNKFKWIYDTVLWGFIVLYLLLFIVFAQVLFPHLILPTILIRAFGTLSMLLLHFILAIGPMCRLSDRFLPLLDIIQHKQI